MLAALRSESFSAFQQGSLLIVEFLLHLLQFLVIFIIISTRKVTIGCSVTWRRPGV